MTESRELDPPSRLGPYRIQGTLGRGGMGVVYRGEHLQTGEVAALKTVRTVSGSLLATIRREIHALRGVRHPGIVRIVEEGHDQGLPWYAMELLQGRTLRQQLVESWPAATPASAPDTPRTLRVTAPTDALAPGASMAPSRRAAPGLGPTLTLLRNLCTPLGVLHSAGLVHRDLKPENIFIREGRPVLVDLGIATRFVGMDAREELWSEGQPMGTIAYMAPEQIRGEPVDARADLYALGCILYEVATGRPPFPGSEAALVLHQHLQMRPQPPSALSEGLPEGLDRLILRLLEKRPQERLGYAEDVATALTELGALGQPERGPRPRPYLYRPALIGRASALELLARAVEHGTRERRGGVWLIRGESGVGKTRFALETARIAARHEMTVITGQCVALGLGQPGMHEGVAAPPLQPLRPLLLTVVGRAREKGVMEAARLLGSRGKVLAAYEPTLRDVQWVRDQPAPPPLPPEAARARVLDALKATLFALTESTPVLLILDDLQWADELTLNLLRALSPAELRSRRLLVVGTYRIEESRLELEELVRTVGNTTLTLDRLDAKDMKAMASEMLALREPPPGVLEVLAARSSGNPFFVAEYLRAAIDAGMLARDGAGQWRFAEHLSAGDRLAALPLPHTLGELMEQRLGRLSSPGRALLEWGAVLGRELEGTLLMAGEVFADDVAAMEAVEELRVRQIIEDAGEGRLRFVHDKLRESAYERISEHKRTELHRRAGEVLEARAPHQPDLYPALAHHSAKAALHARAARYFSRAGDHARSVYANAEAVHHYQAAIDELGRTTPLDPAAVEDRLASLVGLHENLGDVRSLTGSQKEAREAYQEALRHAPPGHVVTRARFLRKLGKTWELLHRNDISLQAYTEALASLGSPPPSSAEDWWSEWIQVQFERISAHYWLSQVEQLSTVVEELRPVVLQHGTPTQRAYFYHSLAQMHIKRDHYVTSDEALACARQCLTAAEEAADVFLLVEHRTSLGFTLFLRGAFDEAEQHLAEALRTAEQIGSIQLQTIALAFLSLCHRRRRRTEETRHFATRCLRLAELAGMPYFLGSAKANLAWVAWRDGRDEEAKTLALNALEQWSTLPGTHPFQWAALLPLAAIESARGQDARALTHARGLLEPRQQQLPRRVVTYLREVVATSAGAPGMMLGGDGLTQALR